MQKTLHGENPYFLAKLKAIPTQYCLQALQACNYASHVSVMLKINYVTGCRLRELNAMERPNIYRAKGVGYVLRWQKGKTQRGMREEVIPEGIYEELKAYWHEYGKPANNKLFHIEAQTLTTYFNKQIRPKLPEVWQWKYPYRRGDMLQLHYILQLKKFRKTNATITFYDVYKETGNLDWALEETADRFGHSSKRITKRHYIGSLRPEDRKQISWIGSNPSLDSDQQTLLEY